MNPSEAEETWEELSLLEDWITGGIRRHREKPDFLARGGEAGPEGRPSATAAPKSPLVPPSPEEAHAALMGQRRAVESCSACRLSTTRRMAVFGEGVERPLVLVIGTGPGAEEDASGRPFAGPDGLLLDKMLSAIGLSRETNTYIADIVKCRPPGKRDPAPDEIRACRPYLEGQIEALAPRAILCLGRAALKALVASDESMARLHGQWFDYRGIPLISTFHPSALLQDESYKRPAWEDLKSLKEFLEPLKGGPEAADVGPVGVGPS